MESIIDNINRTWAKGDWDYPQFERCNMCQCEVYEGQGTTHEDGEIYCQQCITIILKQEENENND